jgi:hypothetical protein
MNTLPEHRRILSGRTFNEVWHPARYGCAIEIPTRPSIWVRLANWLWRL